MYLLVKNKVNSRAQKWFYYIVLMVFLLTKIQVEIEDNPYILQLEDVNSVPAFKIYKNGSTIKEISGDNCELLESAVKMISSTPSNWRANYFYYEWRFIRRRNRNNNHYFSGFFIGFFSIALNDERVRKNGAIFCSWLIIDLTKKLDETWSVLLILGLTVQNFADFIELISQGGLLDWWKHT